MISEAELLEKPNSQPKIKFMVSLLKTLGEINNIQNVDDIYINLSEKLEIYTFLNSENFEDENNISLILSNWEKTELYFPELFIFSNDNVEKMNVLPRTAIRVC